MNIKCSKEDKVTGITADVLRKERIENQQAVIKKFQESHAKGKGDGNDTDKNRDFQESDLEQSEVSDSESYDNDEVFADLDIEDIEEL